MWEADKHKGKKSRKRNVLAMKARSGFWQRETKVGANTMVENTILLQNSRNACFGNIVFILKIRYTSAFKTPALGEVLYFTV